MLFNSFSFLLGFLPLTVAGFFLLARQSHSAASLWLALSSLVFYGWGSPAAHVALLLSSVAFNYGMGLAIGRASRYGGMLLAAGIVVDLALLGYFKYAGFFLDVVGVSGWGAVALPLGISFFTFTQIAYLVDVRRGKANEYNPIHYLLFVTYFPHLVAGPILHHAEMMPQFARAATYRLRLHNISVGASIFALGLAKKTVIADAMAPYADQVFAAAAASPVTAAEAWMGALAYTLQIYFDFSAYSDMAIGLSKMLGVRLPLNFNSPYQATSIVDFWRRWHMTLSRFLRDYLYIPLGGNRHGKVRQYANLMTTMLLGGLWHGAGWTFIIWGGLHGAYLAANHLWAALGLRLPRLVGGALTFIAVMVGWVFFRADSVAQALSLLRSMAGLNGVSLPASLAGFLGPLAALPGVSFSGLFPVTDLARESMPLVVGGLLLVWLMPNTNAIFRRARPAMAGLPPRPGRWGWRPSPIWAAGCGLAMAVGIAMMSGDSPFLYFRF